MQQMAEKYAKNRINRMGRRYGRLVVIEDAGTRGKGRGKHAVWKCLCDCGNQVVVAGASLQFGKTHSCGCLQRETLRGRNTIHGQADTPTYNVWKSMKKRCNNPSSEKEFKNYRGRGIKVCKRWESFETFFNDMGLKPEGLTIERIENDGNYEPGNCRWATRKEQSRNNRRNRVITCNGKSLCITDWAEELGINRRTLSSRLEHLPCEIAFNM